MHPETFIRSIRRFSGVHPCTVPLVHGDWEHLAPPDRDELLASLKSRCGSLAGHAPALFENALDARVLTLPFYEGGHLLHVESLRDDGSRAAWTLFEGAGCLRIVDGNSAWLHALNAGPGGRAEAQAMALAPRERRPASPLAELDATHLAPAYLKFFCGVVWGEHGPFRIVEQRDDPLLATADPAAPWRERLVPARGRWPSDPDKAGHIVVEAVVLYAGALFAATFHVFPGGMIEMEDDDPIAAGVVEPWRMDSPWHQLQDISKGRP